MNRTFRFRSPIGLAVLGAACLLSCRAGTGGAIKEPRADGAAASVRGKIYYFGGLNGSGALSTTEAYDPAAGRWETKAPMPTARATMAAVACGDQIYVMGGRRGNTVLDLIERYDPVTDKWTQLPPMPAARWRHMAAVVQGKIFVLGGITGVGDGRKVVGRVDVFDPLTKSWSQAAPMLVAKSGAATAVLDGKIFIMGGKTSAGPSVPSVETVEAYSPAENRWRSVQPLPTRLVSGCAAVNAGSLFVLGGSGKDGVTDSVLVYHGASNTWQAARRLGHRRNMHSCAQVRATVYLVGGVDEPSPNALLREAEAYTLAESSR